MPLKIIKKNVVVFQVALYILNTVACLMSSITEAGPYSAIVSVSDSRDRGPWFNTQSGHILLFLLLLIQEGQSKPAQEMCG